MSNAERKFFDSLGTLTQMLDLRDSGATPEMAAATLLLGKMRDQVASLQRQLAAAQLSPHIPRSLLTLIQEARGQSRVQALDDAIHLATMVAVSYLDGDPRAEGSRQVVIALQALAGRPSSSGG